MSGYCKSCGKYYPADYKKFDERIHNLECPDCHSIMSLTRKSLDEIKVCLALSSSEIGNSQALIVKG